MKRLRVLTIRRYEFLSVFLILLILYVWFISLPSWNPSVTRRVYSTKKRVSTLRAQILKFREITGDNPKSLSELQQYGEENPNAGLGDILITERISDPSGNYRESSVLDGKGGWYYNKETGEIKINLTQPVKQYVKSYLGKVGNEVPSDW